MAQLVLVQEGPLAPVQSSRLSRGRFILGRSSECDIVIHDSTVSRRHAAVLVGNGSISIHDLGSRNGTFVDEQPARAKQAIHQGQRIRLGNVSFVLKTQKGEDAEPQSELETDLCTEDSSAVPADLSPAQQRVFRLLRLGLADKQIAKALCISPNTVHLHVQAIFRSLEVHSRTELLATLARRGDGSSTMRLAPLPAKQ